MAIHQIKRLYNAYKTDTCKFSIKDFISANKYPLEDAIDDTFDEFNDYCDENNFDDYCDENNFDDYCAE